MKRFYFLVALLMAGGVANAQRVKDIPTANQHAAPGVVGKGTVQVTSYDAGQYKAPGDAIMNEDFANGLAGNTAFGAWTTTGADAGIWAYDTDGPNGDFSDPVVQIITSTTAGNGFMIFDSNLSNPNAALVARVGELVSPSVDLSTYTNVVLEFQHTYRHCCSNDMIYTVDVSDDGFTSNIVSYEVPDRGVVGVNDVFTTQVTKVDLSDFLSTAANPGSVQIRFNHNGNVPDANGSVTSHYFWQIDDVILRESWDQDLRIYDAQFVSTPYQLTHYETPVSQQTAVEFWAEYVNFGGQTANGATLDVDVNDGSGSVYSGSGAGTNLNSGALDSTGTTTTYTPAYTFANTPVVHDVTIDVSASGTEGDPSDNTLTDQFVVTDSVYNRANNNVAGGFDGFISNIAGGTGQPFCIGSFSYIIADDDITSIGLGLSASTGTYDAAGEICYAAVYRFDANANDYVYLDQTNDYTIQNADQGNVATLMFSSGTVPVTAGDDILVVGCHYGGTVDVRIATAGSSLQGTVLGFDGGNALFNLVDPGTPVTEIRMNPFVGIEDEVTANGITLKQNIPNPAVENTTINFELAEAGNVTIEIFDLTGKKVFELNEGSTAAGAHNVVVNTSEMSAGMYYYTLTTNGKRASKKMTVAK